MEPHKNTTEQDFRDKLNEREIMPSAAAWDRLDAMLTVAEEKKSKRGYGWLYIAASILGFLLIGTVFFSQTEEVVDQGREQVVFENQAKPTDSHEEFAPIVSDSDAIASTEYPTKTNSTYNHQSKSNQSSSNQNESQSTTIINQKSINQSPVEAVNQIQDQKLIASTNPTTNPKSDNPVSVKADELLAAAQSNNANPKTSVKVNAKNLLSEVDRDVNLSFREKMLRRAGEVASTVANRNNE